MKGRFEYDEWGRDVIVHSESAASVNGVVEACKELQSHGITGDKEMKHLAEFPGYIIQQYCDLKGITWAEWFQNPVHARTMLNDPDLAYFRVSTGKVSRRGE
jgi:hypothetical protein